MTIKLFRFSKPFLFILVIFPIAAGVAYLFKDLVPASWYNNQKEITQLSVISTESKQLLELVNSDIKTLVYLNNKKTLSAQERKTIPDIYARAVNNIKKATDFDPNSAVLWATRGQVYKMGIGSIEGTEKFAEEAYLKALEYDSKNYQYNLELGQIYYMEMNYNNATSYLEKSIKLGPKYSQGYYYLGLVYKKTGNISLAKKMFTEALILATNDEEKETINKELNNL